MNTETFIEKARKIHGDKYDYSKAEYIGNRNKVLIICPEHGEFWQKPGNHLNGEGCKKCSVEKTHTRQRLSREEFISKAKQIHGNKYDYSKVEYVNNHTKVCIICPKHSEFLQTPLNHLHGAGCPICNESHLERKTANHLKLNNIEFEREKNWEWLKNKKPLHVDFYLPGHNIAIECQGKQHFEENESFGSKSVTPKELYDYVNLIDTLKKKLCFEYKIPIEYINYYDDVEKRIDEIIEKYKNKENVVESPPVNADE